MTMFKLRGQKKRKTIEILDGRACNDVRRKTKLILNNGDWNDSILMSAHRMQIRDDSNAVIKSTKIQCISVFKKFSLAV